MVSLPNQVKEIRVQDNLGKQTSHEDAKKVFEFVTKTIKDVSEDVTKTMKETSKENKKAEVNLNVKLLDKMKDRGTLASHFVSHFSKITKPEHTSHFKLKQDTQSFRVNDLLMNKTLLVTLYDNLLIFRDTNRKIELKGDLSKMTTDKNNNVDLANLSDKNYSLNMQINPILMKKL